MRECKGVRFETEELEHYQKYFWGRASAVLLNRVFEMVSEHWMKTLTSVGASTDAIRQAQGALDALGTVVEIGQALGALAIEEETQGEETMEEEVQTDVGF
jgi:hypothetical protein